MVLLPGYYLWTKARCDLGLNLDSSWSDAARSANNLYAMLARPDAKTLPTAEDFRKPAADLERLLSILAGPFSETNAARILRIRRVCWGTWQIVGRLVVAVPGQHAKLVDAGAFRGGACAGRDQA